MRELGFPEMLFGTVFVLVPLAALFVIFSIHRLRNRERMLAIEKGVALPVVPRDPAASVRNLRKSGIILVSLGLGLFLMMMSLVGDFHRGIGVAAVPLLLGLGLLVEYGLSRRGLKQ
ncbi:MAG TPA: DUF6249 domain-containing protein [Bryobacteraceae bacterium]|nr:DUF6249 domain-containing protein [Bryobacteraceae bacterium]